jgi:hypothetical protein
LYDQFVSPADNSATHFDRYDDDGYFPATPCCKRAVHEATAILEKLGHEIVFFQLPNLKDIVDMYFDHMLADAGETSLDLWEGEILDQVSTLYNWRREC